MIINVLFAEGVQKKGMNFTWTIFYQKTKVAKLH